MNLQEIKDAVRNGKKVCWCNSAYMVKYHLFPSGREQWLLWCVATDSGIGLTDANDNLNGKPEEFYINEDRLLILRSSNGFIQADANTGIVTDADLSDEWLLAPPIRIDVDEWRRRYPGEEPVGEHDVLDFGFWYMEDGAEMYDPPAEDWREDRELARKDELGRVITPTSVYKLGGSL